MTPIQSDPRKTRLAVLRVLVVDDNPHDRALITEVLSSVELEDVKRFEVREASTAAEARQIAMDEEIDVILIDQGLPDAKGTDLVRDLKRDGVTCAMLGVSGLDDRGLARRFIVAGARDFITKDKFSDVRIATTLRNVAWKTRFDRYLIGAFESDGKTL